MAAGASSPELFTAFIALFVNHSAIGVGTVVGSEIFNHMIISAGSVMYARDGQLKLDKWIFTRDSAAYLASLVTLVYCLKGSFFPALFRMFDKGEAERCLFVSINHAAALLVIYIAYVFVCAYFKRLRKWATGYNEDTVFDHEATVSNANARASKTSASLEHIESGSYGDENRMNPLHRTNTLQSEGDIDVDVRPSGIGANANAAISKHRWRSSAITMSKEEKMAIVEHKDTLFPHMNIVKWFLRTYGSSVTNASMCKVEESPVSVSGYMYTKGTKLKRSWDFCGEDSSHRWRLRYFTVDENGFHSRKQKTSAKTGPHVRMMNMHDIKTAEVVDASTGEFRLILRGGGDAQKPDDADIELKSLGAAADSSSSGVVDISELDKYSQPTLIYVAPGVKSLELFVKRLNQEIEKESKLSVADSVESYRRREGNLKGVDADHRPADHILHPPSAEGVDPMLYLVHSLCHSFLYPFKFSFYYTIPDVSLEGNRSKYKLSIASSVFWLAILSFTMIECCDTLGVWVGTSPLVMGLTLSAVGTSFPNLYASMLVARQGQGNMAISNAMGSNVFNICIALGLPWFIYISLDDAQDYSDMRDDGIEFMIFLLIMVLLIYYLVIMLHGYRIIKWYVLCFAVLSLVYRVCLVGLVLIPIFASLLICFILSFMF